MMGPVGTFPWHAKAGAAATCRTDFGSSLTYDDYDPVDEGLPASFGVHASRVAGLQHPIWQNAMDEDMIVSRRCSRADRDGNRPRMARKNSVETLPQPDLGPDDVRQQVRLLTDAILRQDDARPKRPPRLMRTEGATDDIMREWTALGNIAEYVPNPSTGPSMTSHLCPETFTLSLRTPGPPAPRPLSASARPRAERPHRSRETAAEGDGPGGMRGSREEACAEGRGEIDAQGSSGREEGEEECVNEDVGAGMGEEEEERGGCGVADALHWGMEWEEELRGLLGTEVDEEEEISGSGPLSLVPLSPGLDDPSSTHAGTARRIANAQRAGDADAATLLSAEPMALLPGLAPSAVGAPGRSDSEWMRREDEDEELRQALCRQDGEDGIYSRDLPGACWGGQAEAPDMPLHYHAASPPPPCVPPSALNDHFLALRHSFSDPGESFACFANGACGRGGLFCPHGLGEECEHKGLVGEDCEQHEIVEGFFGRASLDGAAPRRRGGRVAASAAEPGSSQWDSNPGHLYGRASVDVAPPQRPCGLPPSFGRAFLWPGHVEPALPGPEAGFQAAEAGPAAVAPRCAPTYGLPLSGPAGVPTGGGFVKEVQHAPDGKCGSKRKSVTGERPEGQDVASKKASLSGLRSVEPARLPAEVAAKSCTTPSGRGCHREAQALLESVLFGGAVLSDLSAEVELEIRKLYLHKRPRIKGRFVRKLELAQLLHKFKRPIPKTKDQKTSRVSTPNSSLHGSSAALFALHSARGGNQLRQGAGASPTAAFHTEGTLPGHQSSFAPIEPAAPVRLPDMGPFAGLLGAGAAFERWHLSPADCSLDGAL